MTRLDQTTITDTEEAAGGERASPGQRPGPPPEPERPVEMGGPTGPEPTRYNDWERRGRCIDF